MKVLIAEDEFVIRMTLKLYVQELGYDVVAEASDGVEAVQLAKETKPDLIIMDINMPNLDGIEAIKQINEEVFIPSIIVSAYHDEALIQRANDEGVHYYLIKPIDINELKIAITFSISKFEKLNSLESELKNVKQLLEARKYIEKAKGILMDRMKLSEPDAMKKLQQMSREGNKKLIIVAKELIQADSLFQTGIKK